MKRKPVLGEKLWDLNVGNAARRGMPQVLTPVTVTKIGRKYFTCKDADEWGREIDYHIETWEQKTEYCVDHRLYEAKEEYLDQKEGQEITKQISETFHWRKSHNLSLGQLRAIKAILDQAHEHPPKTRP